MHIFFSQVQNEEIHSDSGKDQEPWIGVVPVDMDDSKASAGNQESFTDAMVNKVRQSIESKVNALHDGMYRLQKNILSVQDEASTGPWSICADHPGSQPKHH